MLDASRHKAIFNPESFEHSVHIIGCGGMGSRIAEGLARMGVGIKDQSPIHLYDDDTFEAHNIANQWIGVSDVGHGKAERVALAMRQINPDCDVSANAFRVENQLSLYGVVFICVDSMSSRRTIMENVIERQQNDDIFCVIETRMDAETAVSHCFDPCDEEQSDCWWLYWHSDDEAEHIGGCSEPQSIVSAVYGTTMLALKQFEQFARSEDTYCLSNRVFLDLTTFACSTEQWPLLTKD